MSQLFCARCASHTEGVHYDVMCPRAVTSPDEDAEIRAFVEQAIKEADAAERRARWRLGVAIFLACAVSYCVGACSVLGQVCQ